MDGWMGGLVGGWVSEWVGGWMEKNIQTTAGRVTSNKAPSQYRQFVVPANESQLPQMYVCM